MNITPFGLTPDGQEVDQILLTKGDLSCQILTFGATIRSLTVPDRDGSPTDVLLGYDTLEEYLRHDGYLGATVGRYANRIAGGTFGLNGETYRLAINNGPNHLHGGLCGFSHQVWDIETCDTGSVTLRLHSPHMQEGYPGSLTCHVTFTLEDDSLTIRYQATTDRDTLCNLTNHSYFNLSGHGSGPVLEQELRLFAHYYTPTDATAIPLGTLGPVAGTPMDFLSPTPIGKNIQAPFPQLTDALGYDHNYAIDGPTGTLRPAAVAHSAATGITMEVSTTLPGVQFYSANYLPPHRMGKAGKTYGPRHGFCLETQFFPDSPNRPNFPSAILRPEAPYDHTTVFRFPRP